MSNREQVSQKSIDLAIQLHIRKLCQRLEEKGYGTFSSKHEILGVLTEEFQEVVEAVHSKKPKNLHDELLDVGVTTIFGVACLLEGTLEW